MKLFKQQKNTVDELEDNSEIIDQKINETVETLLLILENLGFLNPSKIDNRITEELNYEYDRSLLYRLRISSADNLKEISERFPASILGYGKLKIEKLRDNYIKLVNKSKEAGKNYLEIEEELIFEVKLEISRYSKIINDFNSTVKSLIENEKLTEIETIVMIDYWTSYYKEQKLGYPPSINQKIVSLIENLKRLEYGGYGEIEINHFLEKCQIAIRAMKKNNSTNEEIIDYIGENIYNPLMKKYENALKILRKRIDLLENSQELSQKEKELEIEKFIIDFNERNGHKIDLSSQLLEMKNSLRSLKYSENENTVADWFINKAQNIIIREKKANKSDKLILAIIRLEFEKYLTYYSNRLEKLERQLKKSSLKEEAFEIFKDEINSSFDIGLQIEKLVNKLKNANSYSKETIASFKKECLEIERESIFTNDKHSSQEKINNLYEDLVARTKLYEQQKFAEITKKIQEFSTSLKTLEGNGYNENTINEFKNDCEEILSANNSIQEKELIITQKYNLLKENYYENLKLFNIWKNTETKKHPESKSDIEKTMNYLITLSPKELQLYYEDDDRRKRESMEKHNNRLLVKFLAEEEARSKNDSELITKRLNAYDNGFIPYISEELERAREELEEQEYLADEISPSEKLISVTEYIDSTLFKQISDIKVAELNN